MHLVFNKNVRERTVFIRLKDWFRFGITHKQILWCQLNCILCRRRGWKVRGSLHPILAETNLVELGRRLPDPGSIWRLYFVSMAIPTHEHSPALRSSSLDGGGDSLGAARSTYFNPRRRSCFVSEFEKKLSK